MTSRTMTFVTALLIVAACGGGAETTTTAAPVTTQPPAAEEPATTTTSEASSSPTRDDIYGTDETTTETSAQETTTTSGGEAAMSGLTVAESDLGEILVDADGNTLYLFTPDAQGESTCYDSCADNWPAYEGPVEAGEGADAALIGTTTRDDGTEQVTYNGWPLYYFAADSAPGDTNGQGINDVWFVVDPAGNAVEG